MSREKRDFRAARVPLFGAWLTDACGRQTSERWCEDTAAAGLRFVGFADELAPRAIDHKGWYTDPESFGEVYRGAVWQLPARNGKCLYVAGFADPCNKGAAIIDFDPIYGTPGDGIETEAAYRADDIARIHAEREREYQEKWQAAQRVRDLREDIKRARAEHSELIREIRALPTAEKVHSYFQRPALCDAVRHRLEQLRESVRDARREIAGTLAAYGGEIMSDEYA